MPPAPAAQRKIRVYTKTGDKGSSSLYTGERRPKDDDVFDALGDVDELNAHLGVARECLFAERPAQLGDLLEQLGEIQSRLLDAGSAIATPLSASTPAQQARVQLPDDSTARLEQWIDAMDAELPPLRNFILPVSSCCEPAAAHRLVGIAPAWHAHARFLTVRSRAGRWQSERRASCGPHRVPPG
jgi:ATP:cob(I)alamin adenosyltransferase